MSASLRVLIVEDSESDAAMVVRLLRKAGYSVEPERVETGEAMRAALATREWDVVISDYNLPRFDAPAALALLQESGRDIPLIVVSGALGEDTAVLMMKTGAHDYLMKDNLSRLAPAVEREIREARTRRERREAEEALRKSEENLRQLSDATHEGIVFHDAGVLVAANQQLFDLFGYRAEELVGRQVASLLIAPEFLPTARAAIASGQLSPYECVGVRKDGTQFPIEIRARETEYGGRKIRVAAVLDLSERKQAELMRARLVDDLRAVNEMAIELGGPHRAAGVYSVIADKLRSITDALAVTVSSYRAQERELVVESVAVPPEASGVPVRPGRLLEGHRTSVSEEALVQVLGTVVARYASRREIAFDAVPEELSSAVQGTSGLGDVYVMAFAEEGRLLGTGTIAMRPGAEPLGEELRSALARVCTTALSRVLAEAASRESETRFSSVFHCSPLSIAITRLADGTLLDVNAAWTRVAGFRREEVIGRSPLELGLWVDPAERERLVRTLRAGGTVQGFEIQVRHRSGEASSFLISAEPIEVAGERCMLTMAVDISERQRAEEKLRESEKAYRDLVENLNDAVFTLNVAGRISYVSPAIERVLGYSPSDVLGEHYSRLVHPDDQPAVMKAFGNVSEGLFHASEFRFRAKSGEYRWLRSSNRPLLESGVIEGLTGVLTDVTERRQAEDALRESRERFRAVFQGVTDGILIAETETEAIVMANPAICEMLGYAEDELLRLGVQDLYPAEGLPAIRETLRKHASGQPRPAAGHSVKRKDGSRFVADVSAVPLVLGDRACVLSVVRDMTAFNEMEGQLRQAHKMEAVGLLAGGVAHDFNNILCVIEGHCERLLRGLRDDDPLYRSVRQIQASGERAAALTRQLLAFSRKQPLEPEVLDLNATVKSLGSMLKRLIGEHIDFTTTLAGDLGRTKADPGQIEQVIINLAVNARDAMPQGGRLLIETANATLDAEDVGGTPAGPLPGSYVMVAVTDTGSGMDPKTKERIFEPFFTTKEKGKGTGLGLSTVYGIVAQSGGWLRVDSELGRGSSFRVYLPRTEEATVTRAKRADKGPLRGRGERLLVVEDEQAMREIVRDVLADLGYRVAVAANGGEALLAVEEGQLRPDLLITDVVMPGMSGTLLAARLRRTLPKLKVLFMSGYTDESVSQHGVLDSGMPFLRKPFKTTELAAEVSALLSRDRQQPV